MRSIRDIEVLEGIPVLVRTSLNAPMHDGKVLDDFRLKSALGSIEYLRARYAKVILISHVTGKGTETLEPVYHALSKMIPGLKWCPVFVGKDVRAAARDLSPGDVLLLENLRRDKREEANDPEFAKELAMLADVFVQDSFDTCHREHASIVGVPTLLPSYAGITLEKEITALSGALSPIAPSLAVIGGAKFSTKEPVIRRLLSLYSHVFVGGALANDFLQAKGYSVGASVVSNADTERILEVLKDPKLILPVDVVVAKKGEGLAAARTTTLDAIQADEIILDAGPHTTAALVDLVNRAKTILWNGPLGRTEEGFTVGTQTVARAVAGSRAYAVLGGGDSVDTVNDLGLLGDFSFVSTGGGAMLDYLAYGTLPGIEALR